jgi:pimeloyl-ACP methyl ester carboxylesterase
LCLEWALRLAAFFLVLILAGCRKTPVGAEVLQPCKFSEGPDDTFCGHFTVYENRAAKSGRKIDLKIVIAPALRRDPRPDPLFILQGGPGAGSASLAKYQIPMFQRFQVDRDIVFIDQRGTGASHPLNCEPAKGKEDEDDLAFSDDYPVARFRECLAKYDADPRFYTTPLAMDDIDDVRKFLHYQQIDLWGGSYGTRAALVYLRQHEDAVRAVVLDGVAPTDMHLPLYMSRDGQRALDLLIADCEGEAACHAHYPDLRGKVTEMLNKVANKPRLKMVHPRTGERLEIPVSRGMVASIVMNALYSPVKSSLLPKIIYDAAAGDFQGLLAMAFADDEPDLLISQGMFLSVSCSEDLPGIPPEDITRVSKDTFMGSLMFDTRMKPCEFWPKGEIAPGYHNAVVSSRPVLILSGQDDPVTPPSWGDQVSRTLKNSKHIIVPAAGHGTTPLGCVPNLIQQFLDDDNTAGLDASCVNKLKRPPFFISDSGPEVKGAAQ